MDNLALVAGMSQVKIQINNLNEYISNLICNNLHDVVKSIIKSNDLKPDDDGDVHIHLGSGVNVYDCRQYDGHRCIMNIYEVVYSNGLNNHIVYVSCAEYDGYVNIYELDIENQYKVFEALYNIIEK